MAKGKDAEVTLIKSTPVRDKNKLYKTTGQIAITPLNIIKWRSKSLKCECKNDPKLSSISDSKTILVNCMYLRKM